MGLGNKNRIMLKLQHNEQITGDTNENDCGSHAVLPCKAKLDVVHVSARAVAATKTSTIKVYQGASKAGTEVATGGTNALTNSVTKLEATITAALKDKIYDKGTEFCMSEESLAASNINGLSVDLCFREMEA